MEQYVVDTTSLCMLPTAAIILSIAAWIYLYRKDADVRDYIFWGALILFVPILGAILTFAFFRMGGKNNGQ